MKDKSCQKNVVFFHPDLGIGGAERLVIDAAVGLQNRGYKVTVFTNHCDPHHCFEEARDGTLSVHVGGDWLMPSSVLGRLSILCAIFRQLHLILEVFFNKQVDELAPDAFFVDQLSAGLPLMRYLWPNTRVLFYCHFPDLLLVKDRSKWSTQIYRMPFDQLERWSTNFADAIAVNSKYTKSIVTQLWPEFSKQKELEVVYPCVDVHIKPPIAGVTDVILWQSLKLILSINRFEMKKNVALAIEAFAGLPKPNRQGVRLVIAGGYDHRVSENVSCHERLEKLGLSLGLKTMTCRNAVTASSIADDIELLFLLSISNELKNSLLRSTRLLVYTPTNEHFGIVPLEAMMAGTPVLAANTGGPLETVVDGVTGWLRTPEKVNEWTEVMDMVLFHSTEEQLGRMARAGKDRVMNDFSDMRMAERIDGIISSMTDVARKDSVGLMIFFLLLVAWPPIALLTTLLLYRRLYSP